MSQPIEPLGAASLVSLAVLCVPLLRRLVHMEALHGLRVVLLATPLWVVVFYLFLLALPTFHPDCVPLGGESNAFTITE